MKHTASFLILWVGIALGAFYLAVNIGHKLSVSEQKIVPKTQQTLGVVKTPEPVKNDKVLFVSDRSGNQEIYKMDLTTQGIINLSNHPSDDMNPQIAPDGKSMVFYSNRDGGVNHIYRMDFATLAVTKLTTEGQNFDPSFSPDGAMITFKSTKDDKLGDIFVMNADGTNLRNLTASHMKTEEWDPTFSQDGSKIFFVSRLGSDSASDEIFSMDSDGGRQTQLTNNNVSDWYPAINPKNGSLVYISKEVPDGYDHIFISNPDGGNKRMLTTQPGNNDDPFWSLDGREIVFINNFDGDYDLYTMNANGSNVKKVEDTAGDELSPIFIPQLD